MAQKRKVTYQLMKQGNVPVQEILEIVKKDVETKLIEAQNKPIIQKAALDHQDKENERKFKFFSEEQKIRAKKLEHDREFKMIFIFIGFCVLCFGAYLITQDKPAGYHILNTAISLTIGGIGGYGYAKSKKILPDRSVDEE
jgi:hypothetical protein